ncbi:MAG: hypothetical protein KGJ36_00205 [Acidobacteriota bacterium]|nr:hypothetical protein [Acidobacteriota bacterium]
MALAVTQFVAGALVSLAMSWILVTRIERVGERFGFSEALLGVLAALAADAPEITASITALAQGHRSVGVGVVIGSNSFNLAALLGAGAVVSGFVALHRRVVILGGVVALWIASSCAMVVAGLVPVTVGLALAASVLAVYVVILGWRRPAGSPRRPGGAAAWLRAAVHEEELELAEAIRPTPANRLDAIVAAAATVIVVAASVAMEHGATDLGRRWNVSDAVVGGLVLAAATSLPNAVAGIHLAATGRGAAALSTALNSNNLNVVIGLLIPGAVVGVSTPSLAGGLTAWTYLGLTVVVLGAALASKGLTRRAGAVILGGYAVFVVSLAIVR